MAINFPAKFSALFAAAGLAVCAPLAIAQETAPETTPESTALPAVTTFWSNGEPEDCMTRVAIVAGDVSVADPISILDELEQDPDAARLRVGACRAASGTDDSFTKNFNFLTSSGDVYFKVITTSQPSSAADEANEFEVVGVKVVPFDDEGKPADLKTIEYLYPDEGSISTCSTNALLEPNEVSCRFTVEYNGEKLVGDMNASS